MNIEAIIAPGALRRAELRQPVGLRGKKKSDSEFGKNPANRC
jgi:hypothetical protein